MKKYIKPSIEIEAIITESILAGSSIETDPSGENDSNRAPEFDYFAEEYGKY